MPASASHAGDPLHHLIEPGAVLAHDEKPDRQQITVLGKIKLGTLIALAPHELDRVEFARWCRETLAVFHLVDLVRDAASIDDIEGDLLAARRIECKLVEKRETVVRMRRQGH